MTRKFYTADLHYDHLNVIRLSKRPFTDLKEMQETIITNWNKEVNNGDDVYVLGDICFDVKIFIELMEVLNGQIHIIRGNHDENAIKHAVNGYNLKGVIYHRDILKIKDGEHTLILSHYPIFEWDQWFRNSIHMHGHCHQNIGRSFRPRAYDVGVDACDFKPVTLNKVLARDSILTCFDCMHKDVCKYRDQGVDRQHCKYLK